MCVLLFNINYHINIVINYHLLFFRSLTMGRRDKLIGQYYNALCRGDHQRVYSLIIHEGLNVNYVFDDSNTPAHILSEKGDVEGMSFILARRANPNWKTKHGQTPLMLGIGFVKVGGRTVFTSQQVRCLIAGLVLSTVYGQSVTLPTQFADWTVKHSSIEYLYWRKC